VSTTATTTVTTAPAKSFVILLREHLEAEIAVHRRLMILAELEERALTANDRVALTRINQDQCDPAAEAARLRACRERLVLGLAERLAVPAKDVRLAKLIDLLPEPNRRDLTDLRRTLATLLATLQATTERNHTLIRSSLSFVQIILRAIAGAPAPIGAYDRRGGAGREKGTGGGLVDAKG